MKDLLTLRYSGPDVDQGRMDAYDAAASIMGFADFLGVITKTAYGNDARLLIEVNAFRPGSFAIEFAVHLGTIATIFGVANPKELIELAKDALDLWKFLRGNEPKEIVRTDDKSITVTNNFGQITIVRAETLNVVSHPDAAAGAARFVRAPLSKGLDDVALEYHGKVVVTINRDDAPYVGNVVPLETLSENLVKMWIILESPVFKKDNKWRFSDGQNSFYASIEDPTFNDRIARHEVLFGQDDALLVEMQIRQSGSASSFKVHRTITKVIEHRHAPKQGTL